MKTNTMKPKGKKDTQRVSEVKGDRMEGLLHSQSSPSETAEKAIQNTTLPETFGNSSLKRLVRVYSLVWEDLYGFKPIINNWGQLGKLFKPIIDNFTEFQIASMIILHFEWRGSSGTDEFNFKRLSDKCFPIEWIPKAVNEYHAYLRNSIGLDFDDPLSVKKHVADILKPIIIKLKNNKNNKYEKNK